MHHPTSIPIIAIVGPTAAGKTALSIRIAKACSGEIISADSRQVYRGLDIGSGKVTAEEMEGIRHHLLDVADPTERFTAADFARLGTRAIQNIVRRGNVPVVVGGTGLYIDMLFERSAVAPVAPNETLRRELEAYSTDALVERLGKVDPQRLGTIDQKNPRRLVRAIEIAESKHTYESVGHTKEESVYKVLWLGVTLPIPELRERIRARLKKRLAEGMLEEVRELVGTGLPYERLEELGLEYRYMGRHLAGTIPYEEMERCIESESVKYARRQMTWFKKNKEITWLAPEETGRAILLAKDFIG